MSANMSLSSRFDRVVTRQRAVSLTEFRQMSMDEMDACTVGFGKTHLGKTYLEVWERERSWRRFIINKYATSDMIHYFQMKIERLELELALPEMESEEEQNVIPPKAKAKAKAYAAPHETPIPDMASETSETWDVMPDTENQAVEVLQNRMYQMENVMQEILTHMRQHAPP